MSYPKKSNTYSDTVLNCVSIVMYECVNQISLN